MKTVDIANIFKTKLKNKECTLDRTGCKVIEIIGASFEADKPAIFGTPNKEYIRMEIAWYNAQVTNVFWMEPTPAIWKQTANDKGQINSNYGYLIYNDKFNYNLVKLINLSNIFINVYKSLLSFILFNTILNQYLYLKYYFLYLNLIQLLIHYSFCYFSLY